MKGNKKGRDVHEVAKEICSKLSLFKMKQLYPTLSAKERQDFFEYLGVKIITGDIKEKEMKK